MPTTPDDPQVPPAAEGGPLSLPDEWVGMPARRDEAVPAAGQPHPTPAWTPPAPASGTQNSRAVIGAVLGGLSAAGAVGVWAGLGYVPLLGVVALGIAGIVLSSMALVSVRRGLATNRGTAIAGLVLSAVGLLGVVAVYAFVILLVASIVASA